ncbi:MAG TPA: Ig-like domain-containing protein, partial [Bacteroidota bacterium]|nr:Ig-like domain-containing protein [Bacteroidota bacterium]
MIVSTNPPNYTTRFNGKSITVEFSKYVDHRTVESAVFVSPSLGQLDFDWSGREVEIRFSGSLRRSTTYVVTIGTDVADLNNHNKMAQSYALAFTTGEDIDHGAISGKIFTARETDSPQGVLIFAYKLDSLQADTLDPRKTKPDYVTQSGKDGGFLLQHLTFGAYRVIAVRDEYRNLLYDPETDEFAVQPGEIVLTPSDTLSAGIWMRLSKDDTTAVRLTKAASTGPRHVVLEFSSPIDTSGLGPWNFQITDTLSQKSIAVLSVCPIFPKITSVVLVTELQRTNNAYRTEVRDLKGVNGLPINATANRLPFTGADSRDTLGPRIAACSITDSAKEIDLQPKFLLTFSDAVQRESAVMSTSMLDSSRNTIPVELRWLSDAV